MIDMNNVTCLFENGSGLKNVTLHIKEGETIAVIGPSGSGKSTLVRSINGLQPIDSGTICIRGKDLSDPDTNIYDVRKHIGMVFQNNALFTHKTILGNVMMGQMDLLGKTKEEAYANAKQYLTMVGLGERLHYYPKELSGGQCQRGEIARCLAMDPDVILLDEPTSALDVIQAGEVIAVLNRLHSEKRTMVIVTHDLSFAKNTADRIVFMDRGTIAEIGTPDEIFNHPKKESTRKFVQRLRSVTCEIRSKYFDLYELNAKIEAFARDYFLPKKSITSAELVLEELVVNSILPKTDTIDLEISYSEELKKLVLKLSYWSQPFDPFHDDNEDVLAMLLVRQKTKDIKHAYTDHNELVMTLID